MFRHRRQNHRQYRRVLIVVFTALAIMFALAGCGQKSVLPKKTQVTFHFAQGPDNGLDQDIHSWGARPPLEPSDVDCIGVFVHYPEQSGGGTCRTGSHGTVTANELLGLYSRRETATASIESGEGRVFSLIGFQSTGGCADFHTIDHLREALLSAPIFLAQTTTDLLHEEQTVSFSASLSDRDSLTECSGGPFDWASDLGMYGSGLDGDQTITSTTFSALSGAAISRINGITSSGRGVTVASSTGFHVGDEVLWQVVGTGSTGHGCDSAGPLVSRPAGLMGITTITDVTGDDITLADHIVGHGTGPLHTRLLEASAANTDQWCKMQLVRIPQLDDLSVTGTLSADGLDLTSLSAYNGIVVMKVNGTLTMTGGTISASGKGYGGPQTATYSGVSMFGHPSSPIHRHVNGSGGAGSPSGGGGGGASSFGATAAGSGGSGGVGGGGGWIKLNLGSLTGAGTLTSSVNGGTGGTDSSNGGGGNGGTLILHSCSATTPPSPSAAGGGGANSGNAGDDSDVSTSTCPE